MSWALAFMIVGIVLIAAFFAFALVVYLKEYARDREILNIQKEMSKNLSPIYLTSVPPPPKKKKTVAASIPDPTSKNDGGKNNVN